MYYISKLYFIVITQLQIRKIEKLNLCIHPTFFDNCKDPFLILSSVILIQLSCLTVGWTVRVRLIK